MTEQAEASAGQKNVREQAASEKRRHTRYRVSLPVYIKLGSGELAKTRAVDISIGGVYVEYGSSAPLGKVFEMLFDLPFSTDFKRVYVRGEVVRAVIIGGKDVYGIAFNFVEFARDTEKVLDKYLELRALKTSM